MLMTREKPVPNVKPNRGELAWFRALRDLGYSPNKIGQMIKRDPKTVRKYLASDVYQDPDIKNLIEVIKRIREEGVTILLADQNLKFCKGVADRGYILEKGVIQYDGTMKEIWENDEVVSKYLVV